MPKCGRCGETHPTVADVRDCFNGVEGVPTMAAGSPVDPKERATDKQISFVHVLLEKKNATLSAPIESFTKRTISAEINRLKELPDAPKVEQPMLPKMEGPAAPKSLSRPRVESDGMYRTANGTIWKVQHAKAMGSGQLYAKKLVVERDAERDGSGNIIEAAKVKFVYVRGAIRTLSANDKMTLEEAKAFGALYGTCCQCGRTLTNEESIAAGIGPICAGKI